MGWQKNKYPDGSAEVTIIVVEIAPGGETGWHLHPIPSFGMVLDAESSVELENGEMTHLKAGEPAAEVVNTLHNGRNTGVDTAKLVVFYTGVSGQPLTIQKDDQH